MRDFDSPKALAEYLNKLSKDPIAYNSYFKWKKHVVFKEPRWFTPMCNLCIKLHMENFYGIEHSVLRDAGDFWSRRHCKKPYS